MKQTRLILLLTFIAATHLHIQDKWQRFTEADGLESNIINQGYQAQNGDIWVATDQSIQRFNGLFEEFWSRYGSFDHLSESPFDQILARRALTIKNVVG